MSPCSRTPLSAWSKLSCYHHHDLMPIVNGYCDCPTCKLTLEAMGRYSLYKCSWCDETKPCTIGIIKAGEAFKFGRRNQRVNDQAVLQALKDGGWPGGYQMRCVNCGNKHYA